MKISMKMNCCHCFLWCRGSLQGPKAGMRWRDPNLFGFDKFSVSDSKLSPSACVFFFFEIFWEVQMPMKVRKRYVTKSPFCKMGPIFSTSFLVGCETFLRRSKLSAKRPESWWKFLWFPQVAPSTKVTRDFFFLWGKKTEVKEMVRGRKLEVVLKNLGFFLARKLWLRRLFLHFIWI